MEFSEDFSHAANIHFRFEQDIGISWIDRVKRVGMVFLDKRRAIDDKNADFADVDGLLLLYFHVFAIHEFRLHAVSIYFQDIVDLAIGWRVFKLDRFLIDILIHIVPASGCWRDLIKGTWMTGVSVRVSSSV